MLPFRTVVPLLGRVGRRCWTAAVCNVPSASPLCTSKADERLTGASKTTLKETSALDQNHKLQNKGIPDENSVNKDVARSFQKSVEKSDSKSEFFAKVTNSIDITGLKPKLPSKSYTLVPYVNESETLSRLVKMGINLTKTEQDSELGNFLLRADFERDIQPVLLFLMRNIRLNEQDLVKVLSSNLGLLKEHLDDMKARVNFLRYMKFSNDAIQTIVKRNPNFLSYPTKDVDRACGFVQQMLELTGNETRTLLTAYPSRKLIYGDFTQTRALVDLLQELEGFSKKDVKRMCIRYPRVLTYGHRQMAECMDYIVDEMQVARAEIIAFPYVFNPKPFKTVKTRHKYLKFINRDQFNPKKPNYVSLESLASMEDEEFCEKVAKTSVQDFYNFEKTL